MTTKKTTNNATHIATDSEGELITHLEALRTTLMRCLLALGIMLFPSFLFTPACLDFLIKILLSGQQVTLNFFSPAEVFILQIKLALVLDILICFPYIARQIWNFVLPALYENERRFIKSIIFSSSLMFILGVIFCLIFILPLIIKFGLSFRTADIKCHRIKPAACCNLWPDVSISADNLYAYPFRHNILCRRRSKKALYLYGHSDYRGNFNAARHRQPVNAGSSHLYFV